MRSVLFVASVAALLLPALPAAAETAAEKLMAQQIGSYLKESGQLRNYRIAVKYEGGVAVLNGSVANARQRDTAVRLAQSIEGVTDVECQLTCAGESPATAAAAPKPFRTFDIAQPVSAQSGPSPVMHAFAGNGQPANYAGPMAARTSPMARGNRAAARGNMPLPTRRLPGGIAGTGVRQASAQGVYPAQASMPADIGPGAMAGPSGPAGGAGVPATPVGFVHQGMGRGPSHENAQMPGYAWPSYASYPNYAALTYPKQYSPTAWPYIGPFYPYPQVPLAWRKVSLEWDDGWWFLDFSAHNSSH